MASDPNFNNTGACNNPMSSSNNFDFTDLYQNEESFDLSTYISGAGNLELCNDDLFQNLFPPSSPLPQDLKKETTDNFDDEIDSWYQAATSEPPSNCASACSSAATSPVPFNYYNTPPVTPQRGNSPHHLQFDGLTSSMSSSRFAQIRKDNSGSNFTLDDANNNSPIIVVKPDPDGPLPSNTFGKSAFTAMKREGSPSVVPGTVASTGNSKLGTKRPSGTNYESPLMKKGKTLTKGSVEYQQKRERNNVAVRRSRDKAKIKAMETQQKVEELAQENSRLHERVAELSHELNTLRDLLKSIPHISA